MVEKIEITPCDTPWEIACMLINAQRDVTTVFSGKYKAPFFELAELRRIGEHLINYCNAEQKKEGVEE